MTATDLMRTDDAFDYSTLPDGAADTLRQTTDCIRRRKTSVAVEMMGIGADLIAAKSALGHGRFGAWLSAEFAWKERSVRRFMAVAAVFQSNSASVGDLLPTTLYLLAERSTPEAVRSEFVRRGAAGERIADDDVKDMVAAAKRAQKKRDRRQAAAQVGLARKSPQAIRRAEKERPEFEGGRAKENAAIIRIAAFIREHVGDDLPERLALIEEAGNHIWRLPSELRKHVSIGGAA